MSSEIAASVPHADTAEHHKEGFIRTYIFSYDHKMIGKQYMITALVWALIGMFLSWVMRLQLAYPGKQMPILETLLGRFAEGGILAPEYYLSMLTMHGTIMVFFVLTAGLVGTFGNYLLPLQIGARDMAFPLINMLSYWTFFVASVIMLLSFFVEGGPAAAGWTSYPPLSALASAIPGSGAGQTLWLLSLAVFIVSSLFGSLNYIVTVLNMRTKGMTMTRMPLTVWAIFIAAMLGLLAFPVLLAGAVMLLLDKTVMTSFFLPGGMYIGDALLPFEGGSPILWQHIFWFFGHPEVYIVALPALGIASEVISTNARKPLFGYMAMVGSLLAIAFLSFIVWGHHMFVSGMNPFLGSVFVLTTILIAVPSAVKVFNWLATLWRGNIHFTPAMLFSIGLVSLFITGGLTGIFLGNAPIDIQLHDTYFVVAHFHFVMGAAALFGVFAGIYHWFPKMYGRKMHYGWGKVHFWFTFIGIYAIFFPMHFMGTTGVPRRYYAFTEFEYTAQYGGMNEFVTIAALLTGAAQIIFLVNFFGSMYFGKKAERNPWRATTLEWTTEDAMPVHGNWRGEIPVVYRGPHQYSVPDVDEDYLMQNDSTGFDRQEKE
jgi:cytochrome c oxidase subunit I